MPVERGGTIRFVNATTATLPAGHLDLLGRPLLAALSTRMPDGSARTQPAWCRRDAGVVVLSTTMESREGRNLLADPRATVLVVDPADSSRWIDVEHRGRSGRAFPALSAAWWCGACGALAELGHTRSGSRVNGVTEQGGKG